MFGGPIARLLAVLGGFAAILIALHLLVSAITRHDAAQSSAGAAVQRSQDQAVTIKRVEEGNAARAEIRNPGSVARYEQCLRSARKPEVCQRFMPQ